MHHLHIDQFALGTSPVHVIDPRVKILAAAVFILSVVLTSDFALVSYVLYACLAVIVLLVSRTPVRYVVLRSLTVLPFSIMVSMFVPFITGGDDIWRMTIAGVDFTVTAEGLARFGALQCRAVLCFLATIILVSTTPFGDLMHAAGQLGLPRRLVQVMTFMYRYLFLFIDETSHMLLARRLRAPGGGRIQFLKASGGIVGALFVRSLEHAERLYQAMLLRGYGGNLVTVAVHRIDASDLLKGTGLVLLTVMAYISGRI